MAYNAAVYTTRPARPDGAPPQRDIRFSRTEAALVEVMFRLLAHKSFSAITISEICAGASISRTAFYTHFEDKYSLVVHCIRELTQLLPAREGCETIEASIHCTLQAVRHRRAALRQLIKFEGSRELEYRINAVIVELYTHYFQVRLQAGGTLTVPLEVAAIYSSAGAVKLIEWWLKTDCDIPAEAMHSYIMQLHEKHIKA